MEGGVAKLGSKYGEMSEKRCATECGNSEAGSYENGAWFEQNVALKGTEGGSSTLYGASVSLAQTSGPKVVLSSESQEGYAGWPNYFHNHGWVGPLSESQISTAEVMLVEGIDPGLGVATIKATSSKSPEWHESSYGYCYGGVPCSEHYTNGFTMWDAEHRKLGDGQQNVAFEVTDPVGLTNKVSTEVRVDGTPPYGLGVSGFPKNHEIGSGQYHLTATATDGSGAIESSGVKEIEIKIDGKEVGVPSGTCTPGPCTATRELSISGTEYAVGSHTLVETAGDRAGNEAKEELTFVVGRPTTPVWVGPGSVNPQSGELNLSATDVSIPGPGSPLTVARSYGSMHLEAGTEGPLGQQWSIELGQAQAVTRLPNGNALLTTGTGLQALFVSKGSGEFTPPRGDESLTLKEATKETKVVEFVLTSAAKGTTRFAQLGGTGSVWAPVSREGPAGAASKIVYALEGSSIEPVEEYAAPPAGVKCTESFAKGCRKLTFVYAKATTTSGDNEGEWGDYAGQMKEIAFTAWDPSSGKDEPIPVAEYQYDKEGKLRAEWDPRVSPSLKTIYGYDGEGHVIAVQAAGQQPWILTYAAIVGDTRTGRLLAATRPGEATAAGNGQAPVSSEAPKLSTSSPVEGTELTVSTGGWSNSPLSYDYQWERCNSSGGECVAIPGATNAGFTPLYSEEEHTLLAKVTALNANGTSTAYTVASGVIPANTFPPGYSMLLGTLPSEETSPFGNVGYDAVGTEGVYVTDSTHNQVDVLNPERMQRGYSFGATGSGNGQFKEPTGIAIDSSNDVVVADAGNKRLELFRPYGEFMYSGTIAGTPAGIAVNGSTVYVADTTNNRIDVYQENGFGFTNVSSFGSIKGPTGIAYHKPYIYVSSSGSNYVEGYLSGAKEAGVVFGKAASGEEPLKEPRGIAFDSAGHMYVMDSGNNRVQELNASGKTKYIWSFGTGGSAAGQFSKATGIAVDSSGNPYIADTGNKRVEKFIPDLRPADPPVPPPAPPKNGSSSVWTLDYHVPVSGTGAPYAMSSTEAAKWDQTDDPVEATAVFPPDEPMGWPAQDYRRATVYYLDNPGHTVNVAQPGGAITTTEYSTQGDATRTLGADARQTAMKESKTTEAAKLLDTESTYNKEGTQLESTLGPEHTIKLSATGSTVQARKQTHYYYNKGAPETGGPYDLVTEMSVGALVAGGKEENQQITTTSYSGQENLGWKLGQATSTTADPAGLKLTHTTVYEPETGDVVETRMPAQPSEKSPHAKEVIYYTAAANTKTPGCGGHPEWAGLICQTQPAKQPETSGVPNLPVTVTTYNVYDEPVKVTETVGSSTRTKTQNYDAAGRLKSSEDTASTGTALPTVSYEYSKTTGALISQSTTVESKTRKLSSAYNSLGQLTGYTDADGNTSAFTYDEDGRPSTINDGKGTQTYGYDTTTGELTSLKDTGAGTFTATYDADGNMLTEGYPNGMTAYYTYNQTDQPTNLEYVKTTHCTENCTWFKDAITPSVLGQALTQTSSLSTQNYTYDNAGRLTQVQDTPTGKTCTTRIYAYDPDTNRTGLTTREPAAKGECATEGGKTESHSYDQADRLIDSGIGYDTWGNTTKLPAADAGGSEVTSTFYVDNQLASQTQNGTTDGYQLDPAGRTREETITGKGTESITNHYAGAAQEPAWTANTSGEWTRNIPGISGQLAASQSNSETPVLQLTNLHGDIVATATDTETATGLASSADTTEYGVPTTSVPPKYSWLGALQVPTELPSGIISMGARSYVPQLGRFLQDDPMQGGSANAYTYTFGDPVNSSDTSGSTAIPAWMITFGDAQAQSANEAAIRKVEEEERRAAEEAAARIAAEQAAQYAAQLATLAAGPGFAEEGEESEEEGEEGEEEIEWAAFIHNEQREAANASFGPPWNSEAGAMLERGTVVCGYSPGSKCLDASFWSWLGKHAKKYAKALAHGAKAVWVKVTSAFTKFEPLPLPSTQELCKAGGLTLAALSLTEVAPFVLRLTLAGGGVATTFGC